MQVRSQDEVREILDRIAETTDDEEARQLEALLIRPVDTGVRPEDPPQPTDQDPPAEEEALERRRPDPAARILRRAASRLGYTEGPNDDSWFGTWYGLPNNPWCAMYVSWVFHEEGMPLRASSSKGFAACARAREWFVRNGRWTTGTPKPGYLIFFDWATDRGEPPDHVGIVERVNADGSITTIEGNTKDPKGRRPQGVYRRIRRAGIVGYGIPDFLPATGGGGGGDGGTATGDVATRLPMLRHGADGAAVRRLQGLLRAAFAELTDADLTLGGNFREITQRLVERFQREQGLEADGVVGQKTWRALLGLKPDGLPTLKPGATGAPVRRLQGLLRAAFPDLDDGDLPLGGNFRDKTRALVERFQRDGGLQADGVVGPRTWEALLAG